MKTNILLFVIGIAIAVAVAIIPHYLGFGTIIYGMILTFYVYGLFCGLSSFLATKLATTKLEYFKITIAFDALFMIFLFGLNILTGVIFSKNFFDLSFNVLTYFIVLFIGFPIGWAYILFVFRKKGYKIGFVADQDN